MKYSERAQGTAATPEQQQEVVDFFRKVLGDKVNASFDAAFNAAGAHKATKLSDGAMQHAFVLSTSAPLSTKYHEALHGLFAELRDHPAGSDLMRVLLSTASAPHVLSQIRAALATEPDALAQLDGEGAAEERAAYMYELYKTGQITLTAPRARGVVGKLADWLRRLAKVWSDTDRAREILEYFDNGKWAAERHQPGAVLKALMQSGRGHKYVDRLMAVAEPVLDTARNLMYSTEGRMRGFGIPALTELVDGFSMSAEAGEEGAASGYLQAAPLAAREARNAYAKLVRAVPEDVREMAKKDAMGALRGVHEARTPEGKQLAQAVRELLDKSWARSAALGMFTRAGGGQAKRDNYFPQMFDREAISEDRNGFVSLLTQHGVAHAAEVADAIIDGSFHSPDSMLEGTMGVGFDGAKQRNITSVPAELLQDYLVQDLDAAMFHYLTQSAKAREFVRRFGRSGERISELLSTAREEGATKAELAYARQAVDGMLGHVTASAGARQFNQWAVTSSNLLLLPLTMFTQIIDPMTMGLREGRLSDGWSAAKRGFADVRKWLKDNPELNDADQLAMDFNAIEDSIAQEAAHNYYDSMEMNGSAKRLNDGLFKWNLVEGWSKSMRVAAVQSGLQFIERHLLTPGKHSERWLNELNLSIGDVEFGPAGDDGNVKLIADPKNMKLMRAVNRYVDSVFLRPNQAERPMWANDPRFAFIWHLKQFAYSFERNFLDRAAKEYEFGNKAPLINFGVMVPVAGVSMLAKAVLTGGGDLPAYMASWGPLDWAWEATGRAGLHGAEDVWMTAITEGPMYAAGPTISLASKAIATPFS